MYRPQEWPCLTLLVALFDCLYVRQGFSKILLFNTESRLNDAWKTRPEISRGDRLRLNCITDVGDYSLISIIRPQNAMNVLSHQVVQECQTGWCIHEFGSITCNDMGTYVCKDGKNSSKETEVLLNNCEPRLCNGEEKGRIIQTIFIVNETKTFSLCVVAYPDIEDFALLNSKRIQANRINDSEQWSWYYEKTKFAEFMVHIKVTTAIPPRPDSYPFTFTIFTYGKQGLHLNYSFALHVLGPPRCQTDLQVTDVGVDFVTLSWLPGWDGGSEQSFQVNYSIEDNENWTRYPVVFGEMRSVTITGLDKSTNYTFRILPSNSFTKNVNCENTVSARTLGPPKCPTDLQVTNVDVDFVTLSWLPGWDGGSEQSFQVNYSIEDSENWTRYPVDFGEVKSVTITGLDNSTHYTFRILPSNSFTNEVVDCENTVSAKTLGKRHPDPKVKVNTPVPDKDGDDSLFTNLGVQIAFGAILFCVSGIATTVGIFVCVMKGSRQKTRRNNRQVVSNVPEYANDDPRNLFINSSNDSQEHIYTEII